MDHFLHTTVSLFKEEVLHAEGNNNVSMIHSFYNLVLKGMHLTDCYPRKIELD